ncbi:SLC26A/SulP transporter family protein [Desulfococcaceae bacterium HSG7]|nr:SLC26A/SulP transporter family protein [Desulfococcaceae bacterium HSG7]
MPSPSFKGDLTGAIANTIVLIPMAIGYGVIAMAALGPTFAYRGALMGLYAAIFCAFFAALIGRTPLQMTGPKAPLALVIASLAANLAVSGRLPETPESKALMIISLVSICVLTGGLFQLLFAFMRLGNLVKYIPSPVVAGFMNGVALLLIIKQLKPLMGLTNKMLYTEILAYPQSIRPLSVIVGLATIIAMFAARGRIKKFPAPFVAFAAGIVVYYIFYFVSGPHALGPVIGHIPAALPKPDAFLQLFKSWSQVHLLPLVPTLILTGFFLGILGSMDSLLSAVVGANLTGVRTDTKRELMGQGIGNIVCSFFGGLPGAGSVPGAMTTYEAGGRTAAAGMISAATVLVVITVMGPLVGKTPLAVIAGIIISVAVMMFDRRTLACLVAPRRQLRGRPGAGIDLAVNLIVAIITVSVNLLVAVGIGMVLASALFIYKMGRSVVRRKYTGAEICSKKVRNSTQQEAIKDLGRQIIVFELRGPLFFGSADNLFMEIENSIQDAGYCVLDMRHVSEIDSTGVQIILQIVRKIKKHKGQLIISYLSDNPGLLSAFKAPEVVKEIKAEDLFPDTDHALEFAEDVLLRKYQLEKETFEEIPLAKMDIVDGFIQEEIETLSNTLSEAVFKKGEQIIREGDRSRDIFFLLSGEASVKIRIGGSDRLKRMVTYSPGVIFGEVAFLDGSPRAAGVWVDEDARVHILSYEKFLLLQEESPQVAVKLALNIAREQSLNLRRCSQEVRMLEES